MVKLLGLIVLVIAIGLGFQDPWPLVSLGLVVSGSSLAAVRPAMAAALLSASYTALDFTPWAGQGALRHHDFLALGIAAGWCGSMCNNPHRSLPTRALVYVTWITISAILGYQWLTVHGDPGAIVHLAPSNAWRVAKGTYLAALAVACYPINRSDARPFPLLSAMAVGVPFALLHFGGWCVLERIVFVGWSDWGRDFRIGGPMSGSSNLGGQASEGVVLLLMTWSIMSWQLSTRRVWRGIVLGGLIAGVVSLLLMQTRGALIVASVGVVVCILAAWSQTVGLHVKDRRWMLAAGFGLAFVMAGVIAIPAVRGRFANIPADMQARLDHYCEVASLTSQSLFSRWVGRGLGSFPMAFASGETAERASGWFSATTPPQLGRLHLHGGRASYLGWSVDRSLWDASSVRMTIRGDSPGKFGVHLCHKNLLYSRTCRNGVLAFEGTGDWEQIEVSLAARWYRWEEDRKRAAHPLLPTFFSVGVPSANQHVEVASLSLLADDGTILWAPDRFRAGLPGAIMTTDHYEPFHVENDLLLVFVEQGWIGCALMVGILSLAILGLLRRGLVSTGPVLAIILVGLAVGIVNSPLDTPEFAMLWLIPIFTPPAPGSIAIRHRLSA